MSIKGKKLAVVILEYLLISVLISLFVFCFLYFLSGSIVENYFWHHGIVLTEVQKRVFSVWLRSVCGLAGDVYKRQLLGLGHCRSTPDWNICLEFLLT